MMTMKTMIATFAALALAGGCKKKDPAADKAPTTGSDKGSVKEPVPGPDTTKPTPPVVAPLVGEALAKAYIAGWDAWSAGDQAKYRAQYADDAISHWPDSPMPERKGGDDIVSESMKFRVAYPDAKATPQLVLVNGRTVAAVYLTTGTNSGVMKTPMGDMPATNKKIGMLLFHSATFNDANQITADWWLMDFNTMANQLGMSPQPGRPVMDKGADVPTIVVATGSDVEKANLVATTKGNDDFNKHDLAALMAGWADDGVESDQASPADTTGKVEIEKGTKAFLGGFSDGKVTPVTALAAGDYVVQVSTFVGTNDGDLGPMKKTGKNVKMTVAEITKFEGGKVKQLWRFWDSAAMMKQIMDAPAAPADPAAPAAPAETN